MEFGIWHDHEPSFGREPREHTAQRFVEHPETFDLVATLVADNLEDAYALSQHFSSIDWTKGSAIVWARPQPEHPQQTATSSHGALHIRTNATRSTSVGDVISISSTSPEYRQARASGKSFWVVDRFGFYPEE